MRRLLLSAALLAAVASTGRADLRRQRWAGKGAAATHPDTLVVTRSADQTRLRFDLSALPKAAKVHHASLHCFTRDGAQPVQPPEIRVDEKLKAADSPRLAPPRLEGPLYRSYDLTEAVRAWARDPASNLGLLVGRFDGLVPERTRLEVLYDAPGAAQAPGQVAGLRAVHHHGQTFLVWDEHPAFRPPAESVVYVEKFSRKGNDVVREPGMGTNGLPRVPAITLRTLRELEGIELRDTPSGFQGIRAAQRVREVPEVRYRVYRHTERITAGNIQDAAFVGEAEPLSAYDRKMAVIDFKGEYIDQREVGGSIIPVCCVEDGKPVKAGQAVYVHNADGAGGFYYAVTLSAGGTENVADITVANSLPEPVAETPDPPQPVLQRLQDIQYGGGVTERWYLFWAGPPYANLPSQPFHVLVGEPEKTPPPLPMVIDGFHGGFNIVGALRTPAGDALTLLVEHQTGYGGDGDLLYSAGRGTLQPYALSHGDYFSERYFLRVIDWARRQWKVDPGRIRGGQHDSGPLHLAVRHPEIFAHVFLGNYTASYEYTWSPPGQGLPGLLGPRPLAKTARGEPAWSVLELSWFLAQDPSKDIPLVWGGSNVGKERGHTSEFGWQDDPRGWAALQRARQPHVISWGLNSADPGGTLSYRGMAPELAALINSRRWVTTIPAFSRCSLDDNPGNGDPTDGDTCGQINGFLLWDDADPVDEPGRWEMTVRLAKSCPEPACTVDVTPRHCRQFKPQAGQAFTWTAAGQPAGPGQSGRVAADKWRRVTLAGLKVDKAGVRVRVQGE
ncbi:MAG TPA: hypothetical protein VFJ30_03260 [Phycisphaerae bacterium]|nr:hypothetical protein [Phycisphaerae bacterium]